MCLHPESPHQIDWIRAVDYSEKSLRDTSAAEAFHASQLTKAPQPFSQVSGWSSSAAICSQYFSIALMTTIWFSGEPNSIASVIFSTFDLLMIFIGFCYWLSPIYSGLRRSQNCGWVTNLCPTYYVVRPSGFHPEEGSVWTVKERELRDHASTDSKLLRAFFST